ncbi:hypothetical protein PLCT1_00807 [Planctomycetaceae bacterium]|nr:hypothetical protein PLCT1_00807 [Planctomycetaceae bacterium]
MLLLKAVPAVLLFLLSGHVVLKLADRRAEASFGPLSYAAVSFMLGLAAVSLQMFLYSIASVPFSAPLIAGPWIAAAVAMTFHRAFKRTAFRTDGQPLGPAGWFLLAVILSQAAYSFAYALTMPLSGWDAWFIWFVKARAFFMDGFVNAAFLNDPVYAQDHPEYPLLVPLAVSWIYTAIGAAQEEAGKLIWPMQFCALLAIFHYGLRKFSGSRRTALVFTALLSMTPIVLVHAAGFAVKLKGVQMGDLTGYADLALATYFLGAGLFIFLYARDKRPPFAYIASLMLASGAWTKNEGLAFALLGFAALALVALFKGRRDLRTIALSIAPPALFIIPWSVYKSSYGLGSEYVESMGASVFFSNLARLGQIIPYGADFMFLKTGVMGLVWWAWALAAVAGFRDVLSSKSAVMHWLILGQLSVYVFVYIITPVDLKWHLGTSFDRLLLHLAPLALLAASVHLSALAGQNGEGRRRT